MEATPGGRLGTFGTLPGLKGNDSWLVNFAKCFFFKNTRHQLLVCMPSYNCLQG